jgi:uncharacterized protein (DUF4415 family)
VGLSGGLRVVTVSHCYRKADGVIRLISARKANRRERDTNHPEVAQMMKEYDLAKGRRNPYAAKLKRQVTIRLDQQTIQYFKGLSQESGIPYQTLINLYLRECATTQKRLSMAWKSVA